MPKGKRQNNRSIDIRDICYFIDHVKDIKLRISLIKELGYDIGVDIASINSKEKDIIIGKKHELRIQIEPKSKHLPIVKCAIIP